MYGYPPAERARAAVQRIGEALAQGGPVAVTIRVIPEGRLLEIDGDLAFALTPDDAFALGGETLDQVAARAARALERIAAEHRESKSPRALLVGIGLSVIATVLYVIVLRGLFLAHGRLARGLARAFEAGLGLLRIPAAIAPGPTQMLVAARRVVAAIVWTVALAASYLWLAYVLERFGVTRPWGERLLAFITEALAAIPVAAIEAVPGLFVVMIVVAATLALTRLVAAFLGGVASERIRVAWLSPDAARPTASPCSSA